MIDKLSVLLFHECDRWVAQCLELDISAQGETIDDVQYEFERTLFGELAIRRLDFSELPAAPDRYWKRWDAAKRLEDSRPLPFRITGVDLPSLPRERELRVA